MVRLLFRVRAKTWPAQPKIKAIHVVARWFTLPENKDVNGAQRQRQRRYQDGNEKPHFHGAETNEENDDERERAARHEPEEIAVQAPCLALGIVGAVRLRESDVWRVHWNEPTSMAELPMPKAVNRAFTMTGAPAMMRPPIIESLPESASPRRMANPPLTTQMVPKINPMSMTMPNADEAADVRLVPPAACAKMGVNPPTLLKNKVFMVAVLHLFSKSGCNEIITIFSYRCV